MAGDALAMLERAANPAAAPPGDRTSESILEATLELVSRDGVQAVTMDDIAARAGVGRMTVYRRFGDKGRLVEALSVREARRCLAALDGAMDPSAPIAVQVAEGLTTSLRLAAEHPLLNRLARSEPETVLAALREDGGALFETSREFVAGRLRAARRAGLLGELDAEVAGELLVRLAFSFVLIQESSIPLSDEETVRRLGLLIGEALARMAR